MPLHRVFGGGMRRFVLVFLGVLLITQPALAGLFSSNPPKEWDSLAIGYFVGDQFYAQLRRSNNGNIIFMDFAFFKTDMTADKNIDFKWNQSKKNEDTWMLNIDSVDDETRKKRETIFVFHKITTPKGNTAIALLRVYVDGQKSPPWVCKVMVSAAGKKWSSALDAKSASR